MGFSLTIPRRKSCTGGNRTGLPPPKAAPMLSVAVFPILSLTLSAIVSPSGAVGLLAGPLGRRAGSPMLTAADANDGVGADSGGLYDSLRRRRLQLAARKERLQQERTLLEGVGGERPEKALEQLWSHWYGEEGAAPRAALEKAERRLMQNPDTAGEAEALQDIAASFPDWAEPLNRLATLRYMQGEYASSVELCRRVLRMKPWHVGALGGIAMCHARLGNEEQARKCAEAALPPERSGREAWVEGMLVEMDARLADIPEE